MKKCVFSLDRLLYMGHEQSGEGVHIDDSKVKAILKDEPPATVSEVKSFIGLAQYCAKFVPDFASLTYPLWELTRGDKPFQWNHEQQKAFDKVKALITESPSLIHYRQEALTKLIRDA